MPSSTNNTAKWKSLSEIDYYSLFIKIWFAFNSWYKGHYPQCTNDRECIKELKNNADTRNSFYSQFKKLFNGTDREALNFQDNLEGFIVSLNVVSLTNPNNRQYNGLINFKNALIDISTDSYQNLIKTDSQHNKRKLSSIFLINDEVLIFKALIEILYQVR